MENNLLKNLYLKINKIEKSFSDTHQLLEIKYLDNYNEKYIECIIDHYGDNSVYFNCFFISANKDLIECLKKRYKLDELSQDFVITYDKRIINADFYDILSETDCKLPWIGISLSNLWILDTIDEIIDKNYFKYILIENETITIKKDIIEDSITLNNCQIINDNGILTIFPYKVIQNISQIKLKKYQIYKDKIVILRNTHIKNSFQFGVDETPDWFKFKIHEDDKEPYTTIDSPLFKYAVQKNEFIVLTDDNITLPKFCLFKYRLCINLNKNNQYIEYFNNKEELENHLLNILNKNIQIDNLPIEVFNQKDEKSFLEIMIKKYVSEYENFKYYIEN